MTELLTAAQMRAIEQAAIDSGEVTGLELMERAGQGVVDAILEWRPELAKASHRAVVLCGPGNNGGDGFVVARLLHKRGWEVEVFLYGDETKLPPDAAENAQRWRDLGEVGRSTEIYASNGLRLAWKDIGADNPRRTIFIDSLFGAGLSRTLDAEMRKLSGEVTYEYNADVVSIDCPSGLCLDSGRTIGPGCFEASLTVTFEVPSVGHALDGGPGHSLRLSVKPLGIDGKIYRKQFTNDWKSLVVVTNVPSEQVSEQCPSTTKLNKRDYYSDRHKYSHGHALILSGGSGKGGAARLAARGALRIGAGMVTVGCPEEALVENAARLDAVMLAPIKGVDGLQAELRDRKVKAVCIGPGFGLGAQLREYLASLLGGGVEPHPTNGISVVLDADALTEYRDDPETLFEMLHKDCVLTPHEGEFGRLFPDILAKLKEPATKGPAYSKVDATREAAKRAGCVVLFKGADTVIAHPNGRCSINSAHYERSAPWLATAGSGDVLAGFITGLLARGFGPMSAAKTAAWLHVECALKFGPGLIAEDIPEQLPAVFRDLSL